MHLSIENILLFGSALLFISIVASKTSFKFGIPALILFIIVGMLAGSEGLGGIHFNDPGIARFLGVVALTFILFSGGLDTKWESIRPILKDGISLSTAGILITAGIVGVFSYYLLGFTIMEGMLLGAIVSSTDAAAVFSILRSRNIGLKGNVRPLLEFELSYDQFNIHRCSSGNITPYSGARIFPRNDSGSSMWICFWKINDVDH
jgi:cell volume regulation protein A